MTPEDSDDVLHFRGKTLTPESPRPLHVSEPTSIPVLENQTDPVFNDTSTYDTPIRTEDKDSVNNVVLEVQDPVYLTKQAFSRTVQLFQNDTTLGADNTGGQNADGSTQETGAGSETDKSNLPDTTDSANETKQYTSSTPDGNDGAVSKPTLDHSIPSDPLPFPRTLPQADQYQRTSQAGDLTSPGREPGSPGRDQSAKHNDDNDDETVNDRDDGINFQNLLDNLYHPTSTAPSLTASTASTTSPPINDPNASLLTDSSLPCSSAGLPPRPPPQEKPSIHPNYSPTEDIRSFHPAKPQALDGTSHAHSNFHHPRSTLSPVFESDATSGLPSDAPHAPASQSQQHSSTFSAASEPHQGEQQSDGAVKASQWDRECEVQWGREVQKKYDDFLRGERKHVTEGLWDRFPLGSRLFIGNLPTEKVTKRDLFHLFHKYGKLAQISIKQAYGFVQFVEASSCSNALEAEQGGTLRGRKIQLEISKPQRNTRHASAAESHRGPSVPSSRSPESVRGKEIHGRGRRLSTDRYDPQDSGRLAATRDRHHPDRRRGRDDYRPTRSPSPRGFRRDAHRPRDRTPERYDSRGRRRSRSPYGRAGRYSSPFSPNRDRVYDVEADLPIPKRSPRHVPDVQIIVLDNVDRQFVYHVERIFQDRGLRSDALFLSPRIELSAVIHRQIVDGALGIVKVSRSNQYSGRIPLQVFDRSGGVNNVRFNEYSELDMNVAGDVLLHARNTQSAGASNPNRAPPTLPGPPPPQQQPQVQNPMAPPAAPNNVTSLISSLDGPGLHVLLGALQQQQQQQQPVPAAPTAIPRPYPIPQNLNAADLASLMGSTGRPNPPMTATNPLVSPPQGFGNPIPNLSSLAPDQNLASLLATKGLGNQVQNQPQHPNPQVHNVINQLGKWRQ